MGQEFRVRDKDRGMSRACAKVRVKVRGFMRDIVRVRSRVRCRNNDGVRGRAGFRVRSSGPRTKVEAGAGPEPVQRSGPRSGGLSQC